MISVLKIVSGIFCLALLVGCRNNTDGIHPDILLITTDGQAWEDVPEQLPGLKMPNLARLMEEGVVFEQHYSPSPLCVPARYSMISGLYPVHHQMTDNGVNWLPAGTSTFMEELTGNGYFTAGIGKMDFKPWERMAGFNSRIVADGWGTSAPDTLRHDHYYHYLKQAGFTRWDYLNQPERKFGDCIRDWPLDDTLKIDCFVGKETLRFIQDSLSHQHNNWLLWTSLNGPDFRWAAKDSFSGIEYRNPRARPGELDEKPGFQTEIRYQTYKEMACFSDQDSLGWNQELKVIKNSYYSSLEAIDRQIGEILKTLEQNAGRKKMVIIFTSLHGLQLGDHHLLGNESFYERSVHVPLVIWGPGVIPQNRISSFTSHVDLMPTIMELAGLVPEQRLDGHSLIPLMLGKEVGSAQALTETSDRMMLVCKNYKIGLGLRSGDGELYNRKIDQDEMFNQFYIPASRGIVDSLLKELGTTARLPDTIHIEKETEIPAVFNVILDQGNEKFDNEVPQFSGESFRMVVDASLKGQANGQLVTCETGYLFGFSLFIEKGQLFFGIRTFDQAAIYTLPSHIGNKRIEIVIEIDHQGKMTAILNNLKVIDRIQTIWPQYQPMGKAGNLKKALFIATTGYPWSKPYGNLKRGTGLEGIVHQAKLSVQQEPALP